MCGIVGVYNHPEAQKIAYLGLYALQHRGQESAGIISADGKELHNYRGMGLVADIFTEPVLNKLPGTAAIGHTRYSTAGGSHYKNAQPFLVNYALGEIAVAHNGNLVNALKLRGEFEAYGSIFQSTMDTEVIMHLIATSREKTLEDRIIYALKKIEGAFSLVFLTPDKMIVAGSSKESDLADELTRQLGPAAVNLAGKLTLPETAAVIRDSRFFVGNDGGLVHVAHALRTPLIAVYGPANPVVYGPYPSSSSALAIYNPNASCRPCYTRFRYHAHCRSLEETSAAFAWDLTEKSGILNIGKCAVS